MFKNISLFVLTGIVIALLFGMLSILNGRDTIINSKDADIDKANIYISELQKDLNNTIKEKDNISDLYQEEKTRMKWDYMKNFYTVEELEKFLESDKTNENKFVEETFDCDDYAVMLQNNAAKVGYKMSFQIEFGEEESHMMNLVIIETPRKRIAFIEPQNDKIYLGPFFDND